MKNLVFFVVFTGKYYGPLHFSRHDFVAQTIMRGRDYGLPDYNTVRKAVGLKPVTTWAEINIELNKTNPEVSYWALPYNYS